MKITPAYDEFEQGVRELERVESDFSEQRDREEHIKKMLLAIRKVNQLIVRETDPEILIKKICSALIDTQGYFDAWIALMDQAETSVVVATASSGLNGSFDAMKSGLERGMFPSCMQEALDESKLVVIQNPPIDCPNFPLSSIYAVSAGLSHRLSCSGKTYGILSVSIPAVYAHDKEMHELFAELADDVGFALCKIETERKQTEAALKSNYALLQIACETAKFGGWSFDLENNIYTWSDAVADIHDVPHGYAPSAHEAINLWAPEWREKITQLFSACRKDGISYDEDMEIITRKGKRVWVRTTGKAVKNEKGKIIKVQGSIQDITCRKQAEDKILYRQKSESLGRMAGAVAHHFNNQLFVVMGNLELVLSDGSVNADTRKKLFKAMKAARKAADKSRQMLRYLGQISGRQIPVNLAEVCRQSLSLSESAALKGMTINLDFPDSGPFVRADADQIQQVLTNLFTNARESICADPGSIALSIQTVSHEGIPASNRFPLDWQPRDIPYACLEISDTGCGISKEDIVKIFDPFYTTKFTGRGMGLPVTMGILRTHGGCITVENAPKCGCAFRVYLPVSTEKNPVTREKVTTPEGKVENGCVERGAGESNETKMSKIGVWRA